MDGLKENGNNILQFSSASSGLWNNREIASVTVKEFSGNLPSRVLGKVVHEEVSQQKDSIM